MIPGNPNPRSNKSTGRQAFVVRTTRSAGLQKTNDVGASSSTGKSSMAAYRSPRSGARSIGAKDTPFSRLLWQSEEVTAGL